ncbi:MAG: DNA internalization-related competence protein ComEC/Rec2 [Mycoplasmatota bacterium]
MKKLKIILVFSLIYIAFILINNINFKKYDLEDYVFEAKVIDISITDSKTTLVANGKEKLIIIDYYNNDYQIGNTYKFTGVLSIPSTNTNFNAFNYKNYLLSQKINYILTVESSELIKDKNIFYQIKQNIINRINSYESYQYLHTFILGNDSYIDDEIINTYQTNGISHLFSISGMHVTLLSTILLLLLKKIFKIDTCYYIVIAFLMFYLFLTNFSVSIMRSFLLFLFIFIKKKLKLNITTFQILILICILLLLYNPYLVYSLGFVFSFTISGFLIKFSNLINKFNNYFTKLFATSFISFLASIPIIVYNFFEINLLTPFYNLLFVPLVSLILFPLSLLTLFLKPLDSIFNKLVYMFNSLSLFFSDYQLSIILSRNIYFIFIYFILIVLILSKDKKIIILLIISFIIHYNLPIKDEITFIDIGQGDSTLVVNNGNVSVIDVGGLSYMSTGDIVMNYLKSIGIKYVDDLVLTHGDYDHLGDALNFLSNFDVGTVYLNSYSNNYLEEEIISYLETNNIKYIQVNGYLKTSYFTLYNFSNENENEDSLIYVTNIQNKNILLMGDAGFETEETFMEEYLLPKMDILKVGHHGSKYSTSKEFLEIVNPDYAFISAGRNNTFNHPSIELIERLGEIPYFSTSVYGMIKYDFTSIYTCLSNTP